MKHPNELDQQVENLRTLQQSYDAVAQAAEAYNTGKVQLAENITAKGVPASATETLPDLAGKVAQIAQETTIYEGADSYGKQIGAGGSLWDLYQVLADMKTRFIGTGDYAAVLVCGYNKGYDSLVLQGADCYYTCDGDYYDYASPTHVWHDDDNEKINRWVAFLYRDAGATFAITNTSISPRSIYVGGHIGNINYLVNGRLEEFVCGIEDTDRVDETNLFAVTQNWSRTVVLNNVALSGKIVAPNNINDLIIYSHKETLNFSENNSTINCATNNSFVLKGCKSIIVGGAGAGYFMSINQNYNILEISIPDTEQIIQSNGIAFYSFLGTYQGGNNLRKVDFRSLKTAIRMASDQSYTYNLIDFIVGEMGAELYLRAWNPTTVLAGATKKARLIENIKNHILARVSDRTGLSQLVFTVSTNMYNNIASEQIEWQGETMSLADAFLTKNWRLAGA